MADEKKVPDEMKAPDFGAMPPMPDFKNFDPSKIPDFKGFPAPPPDDPNEVIEDYLEQADPQKWLRQPPHKIRGDMRLAMKAGHAADKMNCNCWNTHCPFHGNCKKCIVFHKVLKQIPTCLRDMVIDLYKEGILPYELYITDEEKKPEL